MNICPKIDQNLGGLDQLINFVGDTIELQLLSYNLDSISDSISTLISKIPRLKFIIVHMNEDLLDIEHIALNDSCRIRVGDVSTLLSNISKEYNLKFTLLFHCGWSSEEIGSYSLKPMIEEIMEKWIDSSIDVLLENTIEVYSLPRDFDRVGLVAEIVCNNRLKVCVDTSHLRAMINRFNLNEKEFKSYYRFLNPKNITHVHLSGVSNYDGFKDMDTHGVPHLNRAHILSDLNLLTSLGIDYNTMTVVPEVLEYGNDYSNRYNQLGELLLISELIESTI